MIGRTLMILSALSWAASASAATADPAQAPSQNSRPAADPNQRICEDVTQVGSRLGTKRICATRAEWAAKRKGDRDVIDQAQRSAAIGCSQVGTLSGTPSC
jgi:hypothetical protein